MRRMMGVETVDRVIEVPVVIMGGILIIVRGVHHEIGGRRVEVNHGVRLDDDYEVPHGRRNNRE